MLSAQALLAQLAQNAQSAQARSIETALTVASQSEENLMCSYIVTIAPLGLLMRFAVPKLLRLPNSCLACAICSRGGGTIAGIRYFYLAYIIYIKTILFTIRPHYLYLDI